MVLDNSVQSQARAIIQLDLNSGKLISIFVVVFVLIGNIVKL